MLFTSETLRHPAGSVQALINTNTGMEMLEVAEKNLLDNKAEVMTYFINNENMKNCPHIDIKIGNGNVKGVIDMGSEISLVTEELYAHLLSQGLEMLELKLQSMVLVTTFGSRSRRIKKQVYIPFFIGDDCFECFSRFWSTDRIVVNWC